MTRYRIAVCDDEPSELEDIVQSVKRYDAHGDFDIENYTDGAVLLSDLQLKKKSFDLLLLDIEMPSNGFQMAQTLTQMEKHPLVIFVTKRHEYAVQGYGIAFRYLVKPLDESLFAAAMDASPIPVFPDVGSMITEPSFRIPFSSASSIIAFPTRSFTLPAGLKYSSFTRTVASSPSSFSIFVTSTSGVFPINPSVPL